MFYAFSLTIVIAMHTLASLPLTFESFECNNYMKMVLKGQDWCVCFEKRSDLAVKYTRLKGKNTIHHNEETTHLLMLTS